MAHDEGEQGYLDLIRRVVVGEDGDARHGRNGSTIATFGERLVFRRVSDCFPLFTTKSVFWRGVFEELVWFIRGSTNAGALQDRNVHIWDGNSSREFLDARGLSHYRKGELGPIYGWQWRRFGASYPPGPPGTGSQGVDQLRRLIERLRDEPFGRRAFLSAWNPLQEDAMALPPCHVSYQFYVGGDDTLSCQVYARSQDLCCGTPFNVASTALLTVLLAHVLHLLAADKVVLCMGDAHVYDVHVQTALEQLRREPRPFPQLKVLRPPPPKGAHVDVILEWLESLRFEDVALQGYRPHPRLDYTMVA